MSSPPLAWPLSLHELAALMDQHEEIYRIVCAAIKVSADEVTIFEAVQHRCQGSQTKVGSLLHWKNLVSRMVGQIQCDLGRKQTRRGIRISIDQDRSGDETGAPFNPALDAASAARYREVQHLATVKDCVERLETSLTKPIHRAMVAAQKEAVLETGNGLPQRELVKITRVSQPPLSRRTREIRDICKSVGMEI